MADNGNGAGNTLLAVLVGALLMVVIVFIFVGFPGHRGSASGGAPSATVTVQGGKS
jgi:hypothetical protein